MRLLTTISACSAAAIPYPSLFGAQFLNLTAAPVTNFSVLAQQSNPSYPGTLTGLDFCNVSLSYTHPGQNDLINVQVWLPTHAWNGRFMGSGVLGFFTSSGDIALGNAVSSWFSIVASDGGQGYKI
jgi:hypothetical protein